MIFFKIFIYLLIFGHTGASLLCGVFSSCNECGLLSRVGVRACLRAQALECMGFSSCSAWAQELRCLGSAAQAQALLLQGIGLSKPGIEPVSPELAGGFYTTGSPGKPSAE